ncbi:conjugal transfer protein TraF [Desulfurispirillum indicum]|uniref:conjugal transfer protein TraF n=1 Tax=Desulfurispirillum indicum TaxID=936456 RepID=UPI001CFB974C|nr:conjugal transfer protein TraF [Desulfurispirillum indicum]UCZ57749.1 conjugal transfer protein TraF [Desulfurispirillum indicum]
MKRISSALLVTLLPFSALAAPHFHPSGPNLTFGDISNPQTIMSTTANPAAGAAAEKRGIRFGLLGSVGFAIEVGNVEDMMDQLEDFMDYEFQEYNLTGTIDDMPVVLDALDETTRLQEEFNSFLADAHEKGYVKFGFSAHAPLMPVIATFDTLRGSLTFDANFSGQGKMFVHQDGNPDAPAIVFDNFSHLIADPESITPEDLEALQAEGALIIDTDAALSIHGGMLRELGVAYSARAYEHEKGILYVGGRLKHYNAELSYVSVSTKDEDDAIDAIRDNMDANLVESTSLGLDVGVIWAAENYRVGATLVNFNEPSFDTPDGYIGKGKLERQIRTEGALYTASRNWVLGAGLDLNSAADLVGDDYQWMTLSAAYATQSWWIPGFRVGYRKNLAGEELSFLTSGVTLFKALNLDLAYSLDSADGDSVPRAMMFNLGLEVTF